MKSAFAYRVKSARIQQGITQDELAAALGLSKQAISQYENGRKKPESATLLSLAQYFGKPASFFLRPVITPLEKVEFRKMAALKGKKLEAVKASILDRLEPYLELESILGIESRLNNPLAGLLIREIEDAEEAANTLLKRWQLGLNPIPNILEMLEDKGIKVVEVELDEHFDGLSTLVNGEIPVIVLNQRRDTLRKRFTAMHELGHLLLEFPQGVSSRIKEKACNRFAGAMLLPGSVLREEVGNKRKRMSHRELIPIKEYYGISLAAIMYRCKDLDILPDALIDRFWRERSRNLRLKQEEGYGTYRGEERAFRFDQLLSKALAEELISLSKAAGLSGKDLKSMKETYQLI